MYEHPALALVFVLALGVLMGLADDHTQSVGFWGDLVKICERKQEKRKKSLPP